MRSSFLPLTPTVLVIAFAMLVALPIAVAAQSGQAATLSMQPTAAGPGDTVEVAGLAYPPNMTVVLELTTPVSRSTLQTVATSADGSFRASVTFPAGASGGAWVLSARSADGRAQVSHAFDSGAPPAVAPAAAGRARSEASSSGSLADKLVLVLVAVMLGALATGALYAWRMVQEDRPLPGMGRRDDVIWSDTTVETASASTACEEPHWKHRTAREPEDDEPDSATSSAQEMPTSA
jgi:hypothetical protein